MITKIEFETEEERNQIIENNKDKYLIKVSYLHDKNILEFSDVPTNEIMLSEHQSKISILQAENADLLLDSASKDIKLSTLEKDLADLTLVMGGM